MQFTRFMFITLGLSIFAVGCSSTDQDAESAARAADMAELAFAPILLLDADDASTAGRFAFIASSCDAEPMLEHVDVCGRSVLAQAQYAWSDCSVELPDEASHDTLESSGSLTLATTIDGDCGSAELALDRTLEFELVRELDEAQMITSGVATLARAQPNLEQVEVGISVQRTIESEGATGPTTSLQGGLSVSVDVEAGTRTASGVLTMSMTHPRFGTRTADIELIDVVRGSHDLCQWPIGGAIVRDGRVVEFSSECGQATLDGEPIDLAEIDHAGRGRGRGRHR